MGLSAIRRRGVICTYGTNMSLAVDSIQLTLILQSEYKFRLPPERAAANDDLEVGSWYTLEIVEKADGPPDDQTIVEDGALANLIPEDDAR